MQGNGKIRNFSKLLITCSFLSFLTGEVKAVDFTDIFEDNGDVQTALSGSIRDVLKEKAEKKKDAYRLSNKGDLRANNGNFFREFLMLGDGNCALYSMGTNHAAANALFLANANNHIVRELAHQEIVDEFDNLPIAMQAKQNYINLKAALTYIQELRDFGLEDDEGLRADIIAQEDAARLQIQLYAMSEEAYTDYVNYALVNGHYMRFRQDVGGDRRTYFIDALAYLLNKNLTIWSQVDLGGRIIARRSGGDNTYLIPSHCYEKVDNNGTLNLIHRGNHFNRLVAINDVPALEVATRDEEEAVDKSAFADLNYGLLKNNKSIEYHFNKMIVDNDQFSGEDKEKARAKMEALKKQKVSEKEWVSQKELKAYCVAFIAGAKLVKEELQKDADIDIDQIKKRLNTTYPVAFRSNPLILQKFNAAMQDAEKLVPKKAAAIAEIEKIDGQISVFEKVSNLIRRVISEDDIFAALSATIFTLGQENEALVEAIEKEKVKGSDEKVAQLGKEVEENIFRKNILENIYRIYQINYQKNIRKRLQLNLDKSKTRVKTWLAKKQTLDINAIHEDPRPPIQLLDDFESARDVLDRVIQDKKGQGVPYLNPEYIMCDPYLLTHNRDVHAEYPEQITNEAWGALAAEITREVQQYLRSAAIDEATKKDTEESLLFFPSVLAKANIDPDDNEPEALKHTLRKRIKRILDTLLSQVEEGDEQERLSAYVTFARLMAENYDRCLDGVELGVNKIEQDLIFSSGGSEVFVEHTISKILTNDKHDFIRQHSYFGEKVEEETEVPLFLLQRMLYPLSLRGEPTEVAYPLFARLHDLDLQPARVMERYLLGDLLIPAFEARTPEKLVSLLYHTYEQGINKSKDEERIFSNQELTDFAHYDTRLNPLHQAFVEAFEDGKVIESEYFEVRNDLIGYKQAFFEYMLKRLGYIIDPRDPSINILSEEPQEVLKELDIQPLLGSSSTHPLTFRTAGANEMAEIKHSAVYASFSYQNKPDAAYSLIINHRTKDKGSEVRVFNPNARAYINLGRLSPSMSFSNEVFDLSSLFASAPSSSSDPSIMRTELNFIDGISDIHSFKIKSGEESLMEVILGDEGSEKQTGIYVYAPELPGKLQEWSGASLMNPVTFRTAGANEMAKIKHSAIYASFFYHNKPDAPYWLTINHRTKDKGSMVRIHNPNAKTYINLGNLPPSMGFSNEVFDLSSLFKAAPASSSSALIMRTELNFMDGISDIHSFRIHSDKETFIEVILGDEDSEKQTGVHVYAPEVSENLQEWSEVRSDDKVTS